MVGERLLGGDKGLEIVIAVAAAARADACPFRTGGNGVVGAYARARVTGIVRKHVVQPSSQAFLDGTAARFKIVADRLEGSVPVLLRARCQALGFTRALVSLHRRVAFARTLKQRIALQLILDIGRKIETRQLQQLDGLHQLRRHHQGVALAHFQFWHQCHERLLAPRHDLCMWKKGARAPAAKTQ